MILKECNDEKFNFYLLLLSAINKNNEKFNFIASILLLTILD